MKVWKDLPDTSTPITASELNRIEQALADLNAAVSTIAPPDDADRDNLAYIDGDYYQATGTVSYKLPAMTVVTGPIYQCTIALPRPYQPPPGYYFGIVGLHDPSAIGLAIGASSDHDTATTIVVRVLYFASSGAGRTPVFSWQLMKR